MRVTEDTKIRTRKRLLQSARRLFASSGFEAATTRDISRACGIAAGTLFNYFPTKEALGLAIIQAAVEEAEAEFVEKIRGDESLAELLFAHAAIGLRHMRTCRSYIMAVVEGTLSPLSDDSACPAAGAFRRRHVLMVRQLVIRRHAGASALPVSGPGCDPGKPANAAAAWPGAAESALPSGDEEPSAVILHLYWSLYVGVLAFWSRDESQNQQDTLALLDRCTRLFVASLAETSNVAFGGLP